MGKEISLILRVVPNLKPLNFEAGDIIYKNGDYAEEGKKQKKESIISIFVKIGYNTNYFD